MTRTAFACAGAALVAAPVLAGLYGDTPDMRHAWSVHDGNRPNPVKVEPAARIGLPPSDAIVLFDGTRASFEKNWCDKDGKPSQWKLGTDGDFYCVPDWKNGGNIFTRESFGDCQLHVEYRHDAALGVCSDGKGPQMHGNSGVFIMGNYEIQVLESYGTNPADMKNPNYADGQAGAVYAENPPAVNPARKPGEWQVYDIVFHQPVWEGEYLVHPGSVTVFFNGVLVQDHWEMEGLTTHCRRRPLAPHAPKGPLNFQDHGCTVHFRNIWIREIPSRWANTTHSVLSGKSCAVMAQRRATAAKLFAKIDTTKCDAETLKGLLEVVSYAKEAPYLPALREVGARWIATFANKDVAGLDAMKGEILGVRSALQVLARNKVLDPQKCKICLAVKAACAKAQWK